MALNYQGRKDRRDARIARRIAVIANRYGWNGTDNAKHLDRFIAGELRLLARARKLLRKEN